MKVLIKSHKISFCYNNFYIISFIKYKVSYGHKIFLTYSISSFFNINTSVIHLNVC